MNQIISLLSLNHCDMIYMRKGSNPLRHGFIYPIVKEVIQGFRYLNLVELFKATGKKLAPKRSEEVTYQRIGIDLFIVSKWLVVGYFWVFGTDKKFAVPTILYLLGMNVFTYFYYHVWNGAYDPSYENRRSRFVNLAMAFAYNALGFAYLYAVPFQKHFQVTGIHSYFTGSFFLSLSRSMLVDFDWMKPVTPLGHALMLSETVSVFMFLSIILTMSMPHAESGKTH